MWVDGINISTSLTIAQSNDIIRHKLHGVRLPCRIDQKEEQFKTIDRLLKYGVLPTVVFDVANSWKDFKKRITVYTDRYKANICYEVLNEPLALNGSPGYLPFKNADHVVSQMNKYIDYIHSRIGPTSVLACGIADAATPIERELLLKVIQKGHHDILSLHIYTCDEALLLELSKILKKQNKPVWITEFGTLGDKDIFIQTCGKRVYKILNPNIIFWFDYNSPEFGIINTTFWRNGL